MSKNSDFTEGPILKQLIMFAVPILFALFLQALYGAVDLFVVGQFASSADVSGVSTGSQLTMMLANEITGFSMGLTVLIGRKIGEKKTDEVGRTIGAGIVLMALIGLGLSLVVFVFAPQISGVLNAPTEAFAATSSYVRICGAGMIVITGYNLIGAIFRGLGDSKTPLIVVAVACVFNILGDLLLVAVFGMGASGAAIATVGAQFISLIVSYVIIKRKERVFTISKGDIRFDADISKSIVSLGLPLAFSDALIALSFLVVLAIVNSLGLVVSAGVGVAEKVCGFIMLFSAAFSQSMAAFVAQNMGAKKPDRAFRVLRCGIVLSLVCGVVLAWMSFFHGDILTGIFSKDSQVVAAGWEYLKACAIDCLLVSFMFCLIGFFNGMGMTKFTMIQGIVGAFCVRIPFSYVMSKQVPVSLFAIGLATPASSVLQILLCAGCMIWLRKSGKYEFK